MTSLEKEKTMIVLGRHIIGPVTYLAIGVGAFIASAATAHAVQISSDTKVFEERVRSFPITKDFLHRAQKAVELARSHGHDVLPGFPFSIDYQENENLIKADTDLISHIEIAGLSVEKYIIGMWAVANDCASTRNERLKVRGMVTHQNASVCAQNRAIVLDIIR